MKQPNENTKWMQIKFQLKTSATFKIDWLLWFYLAQYASHLNFIHWKNLIYFLFAHRNIKRGIEKKYVIQWHAFNSIIVLVQIFYVLTLVSFSSLRLLLSSISTGDRDRYFSRSAGDTEFVRCKRNWIVPYWIPARKIFGIFQPQNIFKYFTNRSSDDGPPNGTLMSSLCKSCGTLSNACGPCGRPIGPANEPNDPASVGIGCGVNGICWACICCCENFGKFAY